MDTPHATKLFRHSANFPSSILSFNGFKLIQKLQKNLLVITHLTLFVVLITKATGAALEASHGNRYFKSPVHHLSTLDNTGGLQNKNKACLNCSPSVYNAATEYSQQHELPACQNALQNLYCLVNCKTEHSNFVSQRYKIQGDKLVLPLCSSDCSALSNACNAKLKELPLISSKSNTANDRSNDNASAALELLNSHGNVKNKQHDGLASSSCQGLQLPAFLQTESNTLLKPTVIHDSEIECVRFFGTGLLNEGFKDLPVFEKNHFSRHPTANVAQAPASAPHAEGRKDTGQHGFSESGSKVRIFQPDVAVPQAPVSLSSVTPPSAPVVVAAPAPVAPDNSVPAIPITVTPPVQPAAVVPVQNTVPIGVPIGAPVPPSTLLTVPEKMNSDQPGLELLTGGEDNASQAIILNKVAILEFCFDNCICLPYWIGSIIIYVAYSVLLGFAFYWTSLLFSKGFASSAFFKGGAVWIIATAALGAVAGGLVGGLILSCVPSGITMSAAAMTFAYSTVLVGKRGAFFGGFGGVGLGAMIGVVSKLGYVAIPSGAAIGLLVGIIAGFFPFARKIKMNERYIRQGLGENERMARRNDSWSQEHFSSGPERFRDRYSIGGKRGSPGLHPATSTGRRHTVDTPQTVEATADRITSPPADARRGRWEPRRST